MKNKANIRLAILAAVLGFGLVSCNEDPRTVNVRKQESFTLNVDGANVQVYPVEIDGKEYLATKLMGGVSLCPRSSVPTHCDLAAK